MGNSNSPSFFFERWSDRPSLIPFHFSEKIIITALEDSNANDSTSFDIKFGM